LAEKRDPLEELRSLFRRSPDAVIFVRKGAAVFANAAAVSLFGRDVRGEYASNLLGGAALPGEDAAAALTVGGRGCRVTAAVFDDVTVLTLRAGENAVPVPPAAISRLRTAAANLLLSLDRLTDPETEDPYAAVLYHSYYTLLHGIEQLSDRNALAAESMALHMTGVELGQLLWELAGSVDAFARDRKAPIRCTVPEGTFPVRGDRERLEQLLLILLSNSLLHTPAGGEIRLSLRRAGGQILLTVEDDGSGLSEAEMAEVFTAGQRDEPAAALSGAGLGLYIAQGIARLHDGTLLLESREGRGTRVTLSLPARDGLILRDAAPPASNPRQILTELCHALPSGVYSPKYRH